MLFFILLMLFQPLPAAAQDIAIADEGMACFDAAIKAEQKYGIKKNLLVSISKVETGRWNEKLQQKTAWPWTVNVGGKGHYYQNKEEAIAAVEELQELGYDSMDVGCMHVNLRFHGDKFANLEEAFDPEKNVDVAAKFLVGRYKQRKDWLLAATDYHSKLPSRAKTYKQKLLASFDESNPYKYFEENDDNVLKIKYAGTLFFNMFSLAKTVGEFVISLKD